MITLLALISSGISASLAWTIVAAGLVIWVIFFVLPLPQTARTILAVVVAVALVPWLLSGCSGLPPRTYSLGYTDEQGRTLSGGVSFGDTRLPLMRK
jgi:hypothetical protein